MKEFSDHIEVNGMTFNKPFVEKPLSAEDHNVYIYYPSSVGGGSQRLFRKVINIIQITIYINFYIRKFAIAIFNGLLLPFM